MLRILKWLKIENKWRLFFYWFFNWPIKLYKPVECNFVKRKAKSLLGWSYFFYPENYQVKSPVKGRIEKIFYNQSLLIINEHGLQLLLNFKTKSKEIDNMLERKVEEGDKVDSGTILFIIYQKEKIDALVIHVYWQPWLIRKMGKLKKGTDYFTTFYYRNPWTRIKLKRHGKY